MCGEAATTDPPVRLETLGGLRVIRDGTRVPPSAWRSRKARDLLKILISRRGRATTRDALIDLLWPGEHPVDVGNRLNVLVSMARNVLDPERSMGGRSPIAGDAETLRLDLSLVNVDVEDFLTTAHRGSFLVRNGHVVDGLQQLAAAEATYTGDFLEEDVYVDWPSALREEARATYRHVAMTLAAHARTAGDLDAAVCHLVRLLGHDPYDEPASLELVSVLTAAGRHHESRRWYRAYAARMDDLGIPPTPFLAA